MNKKLQFTLLLSLVVLLTSFTSKTKENNPKENTATTASFGQLKAAFMGPTRKAFFFTDKKYYQQNLSSDRLEKSGVINYGFKGLVNNIDAALLHTNGKAYFFKGSTYYRYNFSTKKVEKTGKIGVDGWKGVPNNVDAVVHAKGKTYFFKGNYYYRYSSTSKKVEKTGKIGVDGWKGVPNNVDAASRHTNGKIYFFKGNTYYRYSSRVKKVDKVGTIGRDGWIGLSFRVRRTTTVRNTTTASTKNNIRLKVTLTRIKSIQARDSDDIADLQFEQHIDYKTKGNQKRPIKKKIRVGWNEDRTRDKINHSRIIDSRKAILVREGDENHFINNSLIYSITPQEIIDKRAEFNVKTHLWEYGGGSIKRIANIDEDFIEVSIHEVLDYLQNPNSSKYGGSYFKGGRGGNMHEYGAYGDVMWFKKGSNNSLIGHLEFGANNKETYVRLYYRFELVD